MSSKGYVRTEKDMKLLVLYVLDHVRDALPLDVIVFAVTTDPAVEYMPLMVAIREMVESEHIRLLSDEGRELYCISNLGRQTLEACIDEIRPSVRAKAGIAAVTSWRHMRNGSGIATSTREIGEGKLETTMAMVDGEETLLEIRMLTVSQELSDFLENNFRRGGDRLYNRILAALLDEYRENEN